MVKVITGDLFQSEMQAKVNTVNCVGIMGKGIALLFKQKYPEMYEDYRDRCQEKEIEEGVPYLYTDLFANQIINFPTKNHWKQLSNIQSIEKGLDIFVEKYKEWGIKSVAFPPLGCGNGGLHWQEVGPLMYKKLLQIDIPVEIYAPFGTDAEYLSAEYLLSTPDTSGLKPFVDQDIPSGWLVLVEIIDRLSKMSYSIPVGNIVFQKICYFASLLGLDMRISFSKGKYGPYSKDIIRIFNVLGRENLLLESTENSQNRYKSGIAFPKYRTENRELFEQNAENIEKLVDLFSRVKSAAHAEEIATIMFVLNELSAKNPALPVSETVFFASILSWKKEWDTEAKKKSILDAMRYLAMKNWVKIDYSEPLAIDF